MRKYIGVFTLAILLVVSWASAATMPKGALSVKSKGAKGDGKTNDLKAFQAAIAAVPKYGTVWVPAGKYLLDVSATNSVAMKSNMKFAMDPKAILMVKPNSLKRYYLITTMGATNVEIYGGQLLGDRYKHIDLRKDPTTQISEWGYGIQIGKGSKHIRIHDMKISDMWGDGICTGGYPDDVIIRRVLVTNNRRQGLSITTGTNIQVLDSEFSYTNGTKPMYGIDIEPDNPDKGNYARNILIENNYFHHNAAGGIQPYKNSQNVTIRNNRFFSQPQGVYVVGSKGGVITGNTFVGIKYEAVHLSGADHYQIKNNIFQQASADAFVYITGLIGKAKLYIIKKSATNLSVLSNKYEN